MSSTLHLAGNENADRLLADNPFALLVGMLLDQQVPMEVAFSGPAKLQERLGDVDPGWIAAMDTDELIAVFGLKPAIHRFPSSMVTRVQKLAVAIAADYDGDARSLWTHGDPDGRNILARLKALPGFGEQKATIFLALLGKQFGLNAPGWKEAAGRYGGDDVHMSIADVTDEDSLLKVRAYKKAQKAKAKATAG